MVCMIKRLRFLGDIAMMDTDYYSQNKLVCEICINQCADFEFNEVIIFLKENYHRYNFLVHI